VGKYVPIDTSPTLPGLDEKKKKRIAAFDFVRENNPRLSPDDF
jgi:hypothetical protein